MTTAATNKPTPNRDSNRPKPNVDWNGPKPNVNSNRPDALGKYFLLNTESSVNRFF